MKDKQAKERQGVGGVGGVERVEEALAAPPAPPALPASPAPAAPDAPAPPPRAHRLPECPECHGHNTPVVHGTRILPTAIVQYRECRDCRWRFKTTKPYGGTSEDETLLG